MHLWITEYQTPSLAFSCKVTEVLRQEQTAFQQLTVVDTVQYGRMLLLDDMVMTTEKDEFVYHEMIAHIALHAHPAPRKVLIVGGGDGGALREAVLNPQVETAVLAEIDERVIAASRDYFPALSQTFDHEKAQVIVSNGIDYIKKHKDAFDVVLIDSTEPVGPAKELFSVPFYRDVYSALKKDGILVAQSESPFINPDVIRMVYGGIRQVFPLTKLYLASVPTYPSGLWSFTAGSKKYDPEQIINQLQQPVKYYTPQIHQAAFQLPAFVREIIAEEN